MLDLPQPMAGAAHQYVAAMVEPLLQRLGERDDARHDPVDEHVHVDREARLELARPEQRFHQDRRIDVAGARLDDDANVLGRFVAHVGDERQLLVVE